MRTFARRFGQSNKPVSKWTHTTRHLVPAESRHERAFILLADHHPQVQHIAAQPFSIDWPDGGPLGSHTPDFALLSPGRPPMIVDVKAPHASQDPDTVARHEVVRHVLAEAGMFHVVWIGMPEAAVTNLSNFSGARVPEETMATWSPVVLDLLKPGDTADVLSRRLDGRGYPRLLALTLIRRLLWQRRLVTDMTVRFVPMSRVWLP
ncbi:hypothetical protein AX769_04070 [Frondihabitans sp. PAMC 28766]|nr:hypothetical protein AX769_04070 [Frondihabitans sp. PAMC 28766]